MAGFCLLRRMDSFNFFNRYIAMLGARFRTRSTSSFQQGPLAPRKVFMLRFSLSWPETTAFSYRRECKRMLTPGNEIHGLLSDGNWYRLRAVLTNVGGKFGQAQVTATLSSLGPTVHYAPTVIAEFTQDYVGVAWNTHPETFRSCFSAHAFGGCAMLDNYVVTASGPSAPLRPPTVHVYSIRGTSKTITGSDQEVRRRTGHLLIDTINESGAIIWVNTTRTSKTFSTEQIASIRSVFGSATASGHSWRP